VSVRLENQVTESEGKEVPELESTCNYPSNSDSESITFQYCNASQTPDKLILTNYHNTVSSTTVVNLLILVVGLKHGRTKDNDFEVWVKGRSQSHRRL